ncbi:MAG TPA: SDR family NAD(P)-dependent oxidoreductase [Acidimicrobiales bacterium]|nr:SDR family NAD(P)-dependent oxidoreductase [Acidimicrobiales bacterium]
MHASETVQEGATSGFDFSGRTVLVTGAGRGIGRATACLLAGYGCEVVVNDLHEETAARTAAEIVAGGGKATAIAADVSSAAQVRELAGSALASLSHVDFLVNNAGISQYRAILDCSEGDWDAHLDVMAKGTFLMVNAFAPGMVARRFGRIVNLGSYVAQVNCTTKYFGPYCAAKFAIVGLTQVAAQELAPYVNVNAVGPGDVATEMMELEWQQEGGKRSLDPNVVKDEYRRRLLLGEFEKPEDIAGTIAFLCSPLADHITGSHLIVSGGLPYKAEVSSA